MKTNDFQYQCLFQQSYHWHLLNPNPRFEYAIETDEEGLHQTHMIYILNKCSSITSHSHETYFPKTGSRVFEILDLTSSIMVSSFNKIFMYGSALPDRSQERNNNALTMYNRHFNVIGFRFRSKRSICWFVRMSEVELWPTMGSIWALNRAGFTDDRWFRSKFSTAPRREYSPVSSRIRNLPWTARKLEERKTIVAERTLNFA